jgi:hypothetical protein
MLPGAGVTLLKMFLTLINDNFAVFCGCHISHKALA